MRLTRFLLAAAFACVSYSAQAQTGSSKPSATLIAEVNQFFPDQNAGQIIPFNTRQMLLDLIASYLAGTFGQTGGASGQITLNGSTSGSAVLAASSLGGLSIASQTGQPILLNDGSNGTIATFSGAGGAIANNWVIKPGTTGNTIQLLAQGSDSNIGIQIVNKGNSPIQFFGSNPTWNGLWLGGVGVGSGATTFFGNTSGSFGISASATGVPNMSTPWPIAAGGTGDTGTAWTAFTPSPSCGTATFTTNSARSKSIGKTVFMEIDLTMTAVGTCGNGPVLFSPPSNTNSTSALAGFNTARTLALTCFTTGGSSLFSCTQHAGAAYANSDRIIAGGVYESP